MFLYIAQLVHEENLYILSGLKGLLCCLNATHVHNLYKLALLVGAAYVKNLPIWVLLMCILLIREAHSKQTTRHASLLNNTASKTL
jgi:hypothetical protein